MTPVFALALVLSTGAEAKKPGPFEDWVHPIALPSSRPAAWAYEPYTLCRLVEDAQGRKRRTIETTAAEVDLRCEPHDRRTDKVCITVAPGVWPRLPFEGSCPMGRRELRVAFYAGFPALLEEGDELLLRVMTYQPDDPSFGIRQSRWQCVEVYDGPWREGPVRCELEGGEPMSTTWYRMGSLSLQDGSWQLCMAAVGQTARKGMAPAPTTEVGTCMLPTAEGVFVALPTRVESVSPTWDF